MSRYRIIEFVDAVQWWKNGDHPGDDVFRPYEDTKKIPKVPREGSVVRYFRHPAVDGNSICEFCGKTMHLHGWLDTGKEGQTVCPGDYIVTHPDGRIEAVRMQTFEAKSEPE